MNQINRKFFITGFTIVELMVTIGISTMLMSVVMYNYSTFNKKLSLSDSVQKVATGIREMQVYATSVSGTAGIVSGATDFTSAHGIFFDPYLIDIHDTNYYYFRDKDGNNLVQMFTGFCQVNSGIECYQINNLDSGVTVYCVGTAGVCSTSNSYKQLHITFKRPNPDAIIYFTDGLGNISGSNLSNAIIRLKSSSGNTVDITIYKSGQVTIGPII